MNNLSLPIVVAIAVLLILLGFVSNTLLGRNNPVEEVAEQLLLSQYGVDVEFSGEENDVN